MFVCVILLQIHEIKLIKEESMKKKVVLFVLATVFTMFLLGSCKSTSHCPAYSQADTEQAIKNV
jgi:hypothetical protein